MSRQVLEAVIGRAVLDKDFRVTLFVEPEVALIEYELTEEELAALKKMDAESLDACGETIGRRVAPDRYPPLLPGSESRLLGAVSQTNDKRSGNW